MGTSVYTSLLLKDYRRKAGELKNLKKELRELAKVVIGREKELKALEIVICNRVPGIEIESEPIINTWPKVMELKWGMLTNLILGCLRDANGKPVRSDFIADYVIEHCHRDLKDRLELVQIRQSVQKRLKSLADKGKVVRHHRKNTGTFGIWSLPTDE